MVGADIHWTWSVALWFTPSLGSYPQEFCSHRSRCDGVLDGDTGRYPWLDFNGHDCRVVGVGVGPGGDGPVLPGAAKAPYISGELNQIYLSGLGCDPSRFPQFRTKDRPGQLRLHRCTLSAHHHLTHPNTIHAKPHVFTGIRNAS